MTQDEAWLLKEKYHGEESSGFFADCKRLAAGEPLAYVIGHVTFLSCTIWLDSRPLIPRPETEWWTERLITSLATETAQQSSIKILDLCAGSGCIGIALAKHLPHSHVTFGEIVPNHLPTIFKNLAENGIDCTRYRAFTSDVFSAISGTFEIIVSNPPYIDLALDRTEVSVKQFEPHEALYGGLGGLELIKQIITAAPAHLTPQGQLWLEHEPEQSPAIITCARENGFTITTHLDQYGIERYSVLVLQ
jgi:release factor glutamine methyltransferase